MNKKNTKLSGMRVGIIASLIVAMLNLILLGGSYLRRTATEQLKADQAVLEENYQQLEKVNQDQLDDLQMDLDNIRAEVAELKASFPELGVPFDIFRRGLDLARASQLELLSISLTNSDLQETASGVILFNEYTLEMSGSLDSCLNFIEKVEGAGLDSVVMQFAAIFPEDEHCTFEITTRGYPSSLE